MDDAGAPRAVLVEEQRRQLEEAIREIAERCGWGRVTLLIEKGKVRKIEVTLSEWCGRDARCEN